MERAVSTSGSTILSISSSSDNLSAWRTVAKLWFLAPPLEAIRAPPGKTSITALQPAAVSVAVLRLLDAPRGVLDSISLSTCITSAVIRPFSWVGFGPRYHLLWLKNLSRICLKAAAPMQTLLEAHLLAIYRVT